jgi:lysophospholipase L1-like esterase
MKHILSLLLLLLVAVSGYGQKRFTAAFIAGVDSAINVPYGRATNLKGEEEVLLLDVFMPKADTMKKRPLVIFIHGGGFKNNTKTGRFSSMVCQGFAAQGYVTASIDYRLGVGNEGTNKDYHEALYRAQQDGKAAIRFFRKYADLYGIDTSQVFITGSSAGSKTCLAIAYMDEHEVPPLIDRTKWGSLEGASGNEGYSSRVNGVINCWGAMIDQQWIKAGDAPLFNISGTADKTVPYDSSFDYHGFKYGGYILFEKCLALGVSTGWRPFYGAGHTLDYSVEKLDSAFRSMSQWLYTQLKYNAGTARTDVFRWGAEMKRLDSLNEVDQFPDKAIMFLGSSYIRLWTDIKTDLKNDKIINRGFGGSNLRDVAYYIDQILEKQKLRALFMYLGNDIVAGERDKSPDQVLEHFIYVVKKVRAKYPDIPITWLAISPNERRWTAWSQIQEANALIGAYCKANRNLHYINASSHFLGKNGKPIASYYLNDQLHYNVAGYKVWGNAIRSDVKKIIKQKP